MDVQPGITPPPFPRNRRCEWRYPAGAAEALVSDPETPKIFSAKILDLSTTGIGLLLNECLEPGHTIEVLLKTTVIVGEIRNCTPVENNEYRVGVKIKSIGTRPPSAG